MDRLLKLVTIVEEAAANALELKPSRRLESKPDGSHVTNVDRETEALLRDRLGAWMPGANVWGEEFGWAEPGESGLWLIDPIDGTSNFWFGGPLWGISVGFMDHEGLALGAIALPDLKVMIATERGQGATWNGERLPPIPPGPIAASDIVGLNEKARNALRHPFIGKARLTGAYVTDGGFVLNQAFRAMIGMTERLYDAAPIILATRELGGEVLIDEGVHLDEFDLLADAPIGRPWGVLPARSGCRF